MTARTRKELWEERYFRIGNFIAPDLKYSQRIYEEMLDEYLFDGCDWLDAGCGHQVLPLWRADQERALVGRSGLVVGADLDIGGVKKHRSIEQRLFSNLESLALAPESFDLVTCNMVVEHLAHPEVVFDEFYRVLRSGGRLIIHTPNTFGYPTLASRMLPRFAKVKLAGILESRPPEDVFPAYYRANTPGRLHRSLAGAGFQKERFRCIATSCALQFSRAAVALELAYVRLTLLPAFKILRSNLLCVYKRP